MKRSMKFTDPFDRDILIYAFRYALGRRSYAVGIVIDELKRNWKDFPEHDRKLVKREIRDAIGYWESATRTVPDIHNMPQDIVDDWKEVLEL